MIETNRIQVWRLINPDGTPVHRWQAGPTPADVGHLRIQFKWAMLLDEPTEITGNINSPGDQLIGLVESTEGKLWIGKVGEDWSATLGHDEPNRHPDAGRGETVVEAIEELLADAGVTNPPDLPTGVQT